MVPEVVDAVERARRAWPDVRLPESVLGDEIAKRLAGEDNPTEALRSVHVEDLYLALACAHGDRAALAAFEENYVPRIRATLLSRMRQSSAEADETLQVLRDELFVGTADKRPGILSYAGRANLHGWLRVVATRTGQRVVRPLAGQSTLEESVVVARTNDPELECLKRTCGDAFQLAFREALGAMSAEDRLLLKRRFTHGLSCEEIGAMHGVNRTTAFRWVTDARARLAEATRTSIMRRMKLSVTEVSSILRLIQSEIDITLSSLVERPTGDGGIRATR